MSNEVRDIFGFSEDTSKQLLDVLKAELGSDNDRIESCLWGILTAANSAISVEDVGDPRLMRRKYDKALGAIRKLEVSLSEFEFSDIETLSDLIEGYENDKILSEFDSYGASADMKGVYGVTVYETRRQLQILAKAIELALKRISVPKGAKPKLRHKYLASFVADALREGGIKPTAYDDGIYFRVLEILFQACFDDVGPEAHRGHGEDALKGYPDDHDIKYLPPGALDT